LNRLRSQKLLEAVLHYEDFPILLETWRTCMQDEFDLGSLKKVLTELESGAIAWSEVRTPQPSPFARNDWWRQVSQYMYMDDSPRAEKRSKLRTSLLREVVFNVGLRPALSRDVIEQFERKRKRLSPGYSPQTPREVVDWVTERVVLPQSEWEGLLEAIGRDHGVDLRESPELLERLAQFYPTEAIEPLIASRELLPQVIRAFYGSGKEVILKSLDDLPLQARSWEETPFEVDREEWISLLGQWFQFYGPVTVEFVGRTLGIIPERLQPALEDLIDSQKIIQGQLVIDGRSDEICDSENFEILLRLARREAIPSFEPLGIEWLPLFLADYQGITKPKDNIDGLKDTFEQFLCYPAEAAVWESEIFPARLQPYDPSWLDTLMQEGDLLWVGGEGHTVAFCFEADLDLLQEEPAEEISAAERERRTSPLAELFPDPFGRYDFSALLHSSRSSEAELASRLWEDVWQGRVTNDTFISLRRAIMNRFRFPETTARRERKTRHRAGRRERLREKKDSRLFVGNWHLVPASEPMEDLLEKEELRKDRVRLLLDRYGILFKEMLQREFPSMRWPLIFRALRIMELSGEVMSGIFFHGIPGPQFISHRAFRRLQQRLPEDVIYWVNAADPASVCGLSIDSVRGMVPARLTGNHLVYRGNRLVMISKRNGKDLVFLVPPDDPDLPSFMISLRHLLTRKFQPLKRIDIETINDEKPFDSPYLSALRTSFDVTVDYRNVTLYRKMR
jgi:ATP-dependent Lhr-like helicase